MSDHHVAIVSFEGALKREIKRIRTELLKAEDLSSFSFTITASGRLHDGEVKLKFALAESTYGEGRVEGDSIQPVLDELLRRHGWEKIHSPKALAYEKVPGDDTDETLF